MAIPYFNVKVFSRAAGHSAVGASAYRSGEKLGDERGAELKQQASREEARWIKPVHDYSRRKGVVHTEMMAPDDAPAWVKQVVATEDRETLWNKVETTERRKDAQLAREVQVALPRELDMDTNITLVREFMRENFVSKGMIADISIHNQLASDGKEQPHAHIMLTLRQLTEGGFGPKNRDWNLKHHVYAWRQAWEGQQNAYLEAAGLDVRADLRSLKEQGLNRLPSQVTAQSLHMLENTLQRFTRSVEPESIKQEIEQLTLWQRMREHATNWYDRARDYVRSWWHDSQDRGTHRER